MSLLDACQHGFDINCVGMHRRREPSGRWFCPASNHLHPDVMTLSAQLRISSAHQGARAHCALVHALAMAGV
jgi:hypothetical protein